jgi:hypothetical protein
MSRTQIRHRLDSILPLNELPGMVHLCESTGWVSARASTLRTLRSRTHVLAGEGQRCRSRCRPLRCESQRLRGETSQPFPRWLTGKGRGLTVDLSVSGRAPALDKGWSQGSGRDSKTDVPLRFTKTCESFVPDAWGSRSSLVSVLPRRLRTYAVLARCRGVCLASRAKWTVPVAVAGVRHFQPHRDPAAAASCDIHATYVYAQVPRAHRVLPAGARP